MADKSVVVEVAYALPHKQKILSLTVPEGTSMRAAVCQSGQLAAPKVLAGRDFS